ncbi:MAG TPA: glycosyltransferase family 4 protein [Phycisphaerae bacterium]|nr:glycosyltransferase family 4 protein [Phycisphaerae bacterium]
MRIILTVHQFLPEHASGTEILTLHTAKELQRRGHDVTVFTGFPATPGTLRDDQRFDRYTHEGVPVVRFLHAYEPMAGQTNTVELEYNNPLFGHYLRGYLRDHPVDVAHFFHLSRLTAAAVDACTGAGVPTVLTPTDFYPICPTSQLRLPDGSLCCGPSAFAANCIRHLMQTSDQGRLGKSLRVLPDAAVAAGVVAIQNELMPEKWFSPFVRASAARPEFMRQRLNMVDRILAPTHLMESLLIKNGVHRSRIMHQPYGIDLQYMRRDTQKGEAAALRVGFIGTLFEHKGAHLLIKAVRSLPAEFPVDLQIYGKLSEFPEYVAHLKELAENDPRVRFLGTFPNTQIGEIFAGLDALAVPSIWYENTPLVIYSAMAAGCPVIATDLGGMSEAVAHDVNGLLFQKGNVRELAGHLRRLGDNRDILRRLAANTHMPKSIPTYVDELEQVYAGLHARSRAAGGRAAI